MTQLKFKYEPGPGLRHVVSPKNSVLKYVSLHILQLTPYDSPFGANSGDEELALVVLSGVCAISAGIHRWEHVGGRRNVFQGAAHTVYVPCGTDYEVRAVGGPVEVAIGGARSDRPGEPTLITPEQVYRQKRGVWNWERHIFDLITHVNPVSQRLYAIEVITPPGNWSSVPPHKHDRDNPPYETELEEIYFYKMHPEQGFGFQRIYTEDRSLDEVCLVENNIATIQPAGYHPVANHPGYQMYYLNILAGEKRGMIQYDDPQHVWVKDVEQIVRMRPGGGS